MPGGDTFLLPLLSLDSKTDEQHGVSNYTVLRAGYYYTLGLNPPSVRGAQAVLDLVQSCFEAATLENLCPLNMAYELLLNPRNV